MLVTYLVTCLVTLQTGYLGQTKHIVLQLVTTNIF
jgi:hypothetical protein